MQGQKLGAGSNFYFSQEHNDFRFLLEGPSSFWGSSALGTWPGFTKVL